MRIFIFLLSVLVSFAPLEGLAKEPANLADAKSAIIKYHDSGEYTRDIEKVIADAMRYLKLSLEKGIPKGKKPAIVIDVDETALSNYAHMQEMHFGGSDEQVKEARTKGYDPVIKPTLALFRFAKSKKVAIFFLSGRQENVRELTANNLQAAGYYNWDGLILRDAAHANDSAVQYKSAMRTKIAANGYHIILSLGDQKSDLQGAYVGKGFKLPGPFYLIK